MMRKTLGLLAACAAVGCGAPAPIEYVVNGKQQNSEPQGFIEGRVLNAADGSPIAAATVRTFANGLVSTATDGDGRYRLGPLPAGSSYTVFGAADGFVTRLFSVSVTGAAGDYPVGNVVVTRDLDMARGDATLEVQVLTTSGYAANARVYLDLRSVNYDLVIQTTTDAMGRFRFTGLPGSAAGTTVTANVASYDENTDGAPDYQPSSSNFSLFPGSTTPGIMSLNPMSVRLLTSNLSDGELAPTEAISLTFSTPLKPSTTFQLTSNSTGRVVALSVAYDTSLSTATLTPVGGALPEGQSYSLYWVARASNGQSNSSSQSFQVRSSNAAPPTGVVTNLRVSSPVGAMYDASLTNVTIAWDALPAAGGYNVYAKDTVNHPAYVRLSQLSSSATSASVSLSQYDSVSSDGFTTPLGHGNRVTLVVVVSDRSGTEGPFAGAPTVELSDSVAPTVASATVVSGSVNNTAGAAPRLATLRVSFSEPMSQSASPSFTLPGTGVTGSWSWTSASGGDLTITVPAGVNGAGAASIAGAKDSNNNSMAMAFMTTLT